jgi:uncharacterized protein YabN with tetrapyrrole methylase and pyrophosphatase domain
MADPTTASGSFTAIGFGIDASRQMTAESLSVLSGASDVYYLLQGVDAEERIKAIVPKAESLQPYFAAGRIRKQVNQSVRDILVSRVRGGFQVVVVCSGHPALMVWPVQQAIKICFEEGYRTRVLPGISTIDCAIADFAGILPFRGVQCYDATDFLMYKINVDVSFPLLLMQPASAGDQVLGAHAYIHVLRDMLVQIYGEQHGIFLYEAENGDNQRNILSIQLRMLDLSMCPRCSLLIPPKHGRSLDQDRLRLSHYSSCD